MARIRDANLYHDLAVAARAAGNVTEALKAEQAALPSRDRIPPRSTASGSCTPRRAVQPRRRRRSLAPRISIHRTLSYWTNLGNARRELGDWPQAESAYRRALSDPRFGDAANGLGTILSRPKARGGGAVVRARRAAGTRLLEARLNLGIAFQESGQAARAAAVYRGILASAPPRFARERAAAGDLLRQVAK